MKVKVIGAGSIGNHLTQAARRMGWSVTVVDRDPKALERMKNEIYPTRYGAWDEAIELFTSDMEPKGGFDLIFIGTPPHVRIPLALEALKENPKILQLEKPLSRPDKDELKLFLDAYNSVSQKPIVVMGYDHAISSSINFVSSLLEANVVGEVETLDVEFREHWKGIFSAHPWLSGPQDSYLGFTEKGGGASGEHSHALHLWQYLARKAGLGEWKEMAVSLKYEEENGAKYDSIASFLFKTHKGKIGRVIQDVITLPTRKWARFQAKNGFIEWICNGTPEGDLVRYQIYGSDLIEKIFTKKRPDDFYAEMLHIDDLLTGKVKETDSPISLESGVKVMEVLLSINDSENNFVPIKNLRN